jgi:hypothetical protein
LSWLLAQVKYKDGEKTIVVPSDAEVVKLIAGGSDCDMAVMPTNVLLFIRHRALGDRDDGSAIYCWRVMEHQMHASVQPALRPSVHKPLITSPK